MYYFFKDFLDRFIALIALIVLSPFFFTLFFFNLINDFGTLFIFQNRVGKNGKIFKIFKFRTKLKNKKKLLNSNPNFIKRTYLGKVLNLNLVQRLPQLINILLGEMSFIGPNPSLVSQVEIIELRFRNGSLSLKPGIISLAQICQINSTGKKNIAY